MALQYFLTNSDRTEMEEARATADAALEQKIEEAKEQAEERSNEVEESVQQLREDVEANEQRQAQVNTNLENQIKGTDLLVVTQSNGVASCTPIAIYNHVTHGGHVIFQAGIFVYHLVKLDTNVAVFANASVPSNTALAQTVTIDSDGNCVIEDNPVSGSALQELMEETDIKNDLVINSLELRMNEQIQEVDLRYDLLTKGLRSDVESLKLMIVTAENSIATHTSAEIIQHIEAGGSVIFVENNLAHSLHSYQESMVVFKTTNTDGFFKNVSQQFVTIDETANVTVETSQIHVPDKLPNPAVLKFTGAATGTYDGTSPVTINIPEPGNLSEDTIKEVVSDYLEENPVSDANSVKTVNGIAPDANGNVEIPIPDSDPVDDEQIAAAVSNYLTENPVEGGMTKTEKDLILAMFRNAGYTSATMKATFTQLETLWNGSGDDTGGGDVHTHSYKSSITTAATCTTAGVQTSTCSCGHSYTTSIPATGHKYVDGVCIVCGASDPTYEPGVTLTSISATYSGGNVLVGTAVNSLTGITVTAHYSNGTSATVIGYTLSGSIAEGNNTITVTYEGKTATFTVVGINEVAVTLTSISATYSGGDVTVGTAVNALTGIVVTAHYSNGTSATVTGYTLSGTITEGSNTITVGYGGKTTTFTVTGVAEEPEAPTAQNVFAWNDYSKTFDAASNLVVGDNSVSFASTQQGGYYAGIEVEAGKTYTLFFDTNNQYAGINILKNDSNQYVYGIPSVATVYGKTKDNCYTFTVDSDNPYIILGFLCYPVDGTTVSEWTNIALFEGTFTERPISEDRTLTHISATYSGGSVEAGTSASALTGIVVTAHYSDGTSKTVTGYTLSGTIAEGSNTITVRYLGKTTTFAVTGVAKPSSGGSEAVNLYSGQLAGTATNVTNLHMEGNTITYAPQANGSLCNVTVEGLEADKEYTIFVESTRNDYGSAYTECRLQTANGWAQGTKLALFYPSWSAAGNNYATFTANGNTLYLFFCDIGKDVPGTNPTLTVYIYEGTLTERP